MKLFSTQDKKIDNYRYDIPSLVRNRLLMVIAKFPRIQRVLDAVAQELMGKYGYLHGEMILPEHHPAIRHFHTCDDKQVLDFLQVLFRFTSIGDERFVDEFNEVFREEGIGYQLTPMTSKIVEGGGELFGHTVDSYDVTYPTVQRLDNTVLHQEMKECLTLLTAPEYKTANDEFLKAHDHYRHNRYDEALAYCCSSFESVMKTVLAKKGVTPKPNATANPLVQECIKAGILPSFYEGCFVAVASIRNALSDAAHGKGPGPKVPVERKSVEHLLHLAATNMVLLVNSV